MHAWVLQHLFDGGEEGASVCKSCPGGGRVWVYYACQECGGDGEDSVDVALAYDGDSYARWGGMGAWIIWGKDIRGTSG
jgi:RecJ-like exonuclease